MEGELPDRIILIGPMGAGKTTVGKHLAELLRCDFSDVDGAIEARTGVEVSRIFDIEGEQGFRTREHQMVVELCRRRRLVIATGGGVVLSQANRDILRQRGFVVYLKTTVAQQLRRLERDRRRPLLQAPDREARLKAMAQEREPLYQETADLIVASDGRSVPAMAVLVRQSIEKALGLHVY